MGKQISSKDIYNQQGYGRGYISAGMYAKPEARLQAAQVNLARSADLQARWNLQQAQEAWELKKKTAEASGKLAGDFLNLWAGGIGQVGDFYKNLISGITSKEGPMAGQMNRLNELTDKIGQEYEQYKQDFGDISKEFIQRAREEANLRRDLGLQLGEMSNPDYAGVTGRAAADVKTQSEITRQSEARRLLGLGIDPTSGRFGALTRRSFLDEARNTAIAMNVARNMEKTRATKAKGELMGVLDPTKLATIGIGLNKEGQNLLEMQGNLAKAGVSAKTAETKVLGDLASGYAKNVTQPFGEMAGYFVGRSGGLGLPSQIASYRTQAIPGQIQLPQAAYNTGS